MKIKATFDDDEEIKMLRKLLSPIITKCKIKKGAKMQYSIAYIETK